IETTASPFAPHPRHLTRYLKHPRLIAEPEPQLRRQQCDVRQTVQSTSRCRPTGDPRSVPGRGAASGTVFPECSTRPVSMIINADLAESSSTVTAAGNDPPGWKTAMMMRQVEFRNGSLLTRLQHHILQLNIR